MELVISKEKGIFEISLDGEVLMVLDPILTREITLFPGQTATVTIRQPEDEVTVEVTATRNGQKAKRWNTAYLIKNEPLPAAMLSETFPIGRWIRELSDELKKIPLREEWELEF